MDIGNESGLRTPDAGLPYPTSMLRTVRSKEEFERALQQQAAAVVAKGVRLLVLVPSGDH